MTDGDSFDRVLASLWEAALDDTLWPAAAVAIDEACAIKGNNLVVARHDGGDGAQLLFQAGYHRGEPRPDFDRDYVENYYATDERVPRMMRLADLQWAPMRALYSEDERKTSPTYNEAMPRYGAQDGLNARMNGPEGSLIFWIPFDPVRPGGWESDRLATVDRLLPHIRRFVRVRQALADAGALRETLAGLLDNTAVGIVQLDWRGRIVEANERAAAHFRNGAGLTDLGGFAGARRPADDARLGRMLARALPGNGAPVAGSMTVARPPGLPPLTLHVCPVPARRGGVRPAPRRRAAADRRPGGGAGGARGSGGGARPDAGREARRNARKPGASCPCTRGYCSQYHQLGTQASGTMGSGTARGPAWAATVSYHADGST